MNRFHGFESGLEKGFILPLVIIISLIIMTALGVWYRQVILQSFLSDRLIQQRAIFIECRSLLPILKEMAFHLTEEELKKEDEDFLLVEDQDELRWSISRSAITNHKLVFVFKPERHYAKPVRLTIGAMED